MITGTFGFGRKEGGATPNTRFGVARTTTSYQLINELMAQSFAQWEPDIDWAWSSLHGLAQGDRRIESAGRAVHKPCERDEV